MQEAERLGVVPSGFVNVNGFRRAMASARNAAQTALYEDEIAANRENQGLPPFRTEQDVARDRAATARERAGASSQDWNLSSRGEAYSSLLGDLRATEETKRIHNQAVFRGGAQGPGDPFVGATSGSAPQPPTSGGIYSWAAVNLGMTMNQVDMVLGAQDIQAGGAQTLQKTKALATYHRARGGGVSIKSQYGDISPYTAHTSTVAEHQLLAQGRHISDIRQVREGEYYSGQRAGPISTLGAIPGVATTPEGLVTTGAKPSRMAKALRLGMQQYQVFYEGPGVGKPQLSQTRAQEAQVPEIVQRTDAFVAFSRTPPEGASYRDPEAFGVPVRPILRKTRIPTDVTPTIKEGQIYRGGAPIPAYKGHEGFDLGPHYQSVRVSRVTETAIKGQPYLSVELAARMSKTALVAGKSAGLKGGDVTYPGLQEAWGASYLAGDVRDIYQLGAGVAAVATPEERERFFPGASQFETFGTEQQEAFRSYLMQPSTIQERWAKTPQQYRRDDPIVQEKLRQGMLREVDKSGAPEGSFWGEEKAIGLELPIGMQFTSAWQWRKQTIGLEEKEFLGRFHPRFVEKYGSTAQAAKDAASNIGQAYLANRDMREMATFGVEEVAKVQGQLEETASAALLKRGLEPGTSVFQMQYPQEFMKAIGQHEKFGGRGMRFDLPGGRSIVAPNPAAALQYVGSDRPGVALRGIASNMYSLIDAQLAQRGGIYRLGGQEGEISEEDLGGLSIKSASELQQRALGEQLRGGFGGEIPGVADIVGSQAWRRSMAGLQMGGARFGGQMRIGEELPTTRWAGGRGVLRPLLQGMGIGGKDLRQLERRLLHGKGPGLDVLAGAYPGLTEAQYKMVLGYMSPAEYAEKGFGTAKEYFAKYGAVGGLSRGVVQAMGKDVDVDPLELKAIAEYTKRRGGGFDYEQLHEGDAPSGAQIRRWATEHGAQETRSEIEKIRAVTSPEQARELIAGMGTSKTWDEMAETTLQREQTKLGTGGIYNLTLRAMQQRMLGDDPTSTAARMEMGALSLTAIDQQAISAQMSKALDVSQTLNIASGGYFKRGEGEPGYAGTGRWYGLGSAFRATAKSLWDIPSSELSARTKAAASLDPSVVGRKPVFDLAHAIRKGDTGAAFDIMGQHIGGGSLEEIQAVSPWMGETLGRATERGVRQAGEVRPTASGARVYLPGEEEYAGAERADLSKQLVHALGSQNITPEAAVEGLLSSNRPGHREQAFQIARMMDIPIEKLIGRDVSELGVARAGSVAASVQAVKEAVSQPKPVAAQVAPTGVTPDIETPAWLQQTSGKAGVGVPDWLQSNMDTFAKVAEKAGLFPKVAGLAAQRKTVKEMASELGVEENLVKAARFKMGIPSWTTGTQISGAAVESPEFTEWKKKYEQSTAGVAPPQKPPASPVAVAAPEPEQKPVRPGDIDLTVDYAATKPIAYGETPRIRPDLTPTDEWLMNTPDGIQMARMATEVGIDIKTLPPDPGRARTVIETTLGKTRKPGGAEVVGGGAATSFGGFAAIGQEAAGGESAWSFTVARDQAGNLKAFSKTEEAAFTKGDWRIPELKENAALMAAFNKALKPAEEWTNEYVKGLKKTVKAIKPFSDRLETLKEGALKAGPEVSGISDFAAGLPLYGRGERGRRGIVPEVDRQIKMREAMALITGDGGGGAGGGGFGGLWTPPTTGRPTGGGLLGAGAAGLGKVFSGWELMRLQRYWSILGAPVFNEQIPAAAEAGMGAFQAGVGIGGIQTGEFPGGAAGGLMAFEAQKQAGLIRSGQIGYAAYGAGGPSAGRDAQALLGPSAAWALQLGAVATWGGTALGALGYGGTALGSMGAASATVGLPVALASFAALSTRATAQYTMNRSTDTAENEIRRYRALQGGDIGGRVSLSPDYIGAQILGALPGGGGVSTFGDWVAEQGGLGGQITGTPLDQLSAGDRGAAIADIATQLRERGGAFRAMEPPDLTALIGKAAPYLPEIGTMTAEQIAQQPPELLQIMAETGLDPAKYQDLASKLRLGPTGGGDIVTTIGRMPQYQQNQAISTMGKWAPMQQWGMGGQEIMQRAASPYQTKEERTQAWLEMSGRAEMAKGRVGQEGWVEYAQQANEIWQTPLAFPDLDIRGQARMEQLQGPVAALMARGRDMQPPEPDAGSEEISAWLDEQYGQLPRLRAEAQLGGTFEQMGIGGTRADLAVQAAGRIGGMTGIRGTQGFLGGDRFVASMIGQANVGGPGAEAGQIFKDSMLAALQSWMPSEEFKKISAMADAIKPVIETATGLPMGTTEMWKGFAGNQMMQFRMQGAFDKEGLGLDEDVTSRILALAEEKGARGLQQEQQVLQAQLQRRQEQRAGEQLELQGVSQFGGTFSYPGVGTLETRGSFAIQDELRNLSRIWEDFTQDYNNQSRQLAYNQFMENLGVQQARMPIRFEQQREDIAFQGQQAAMQFGWQMEDIEENLRFASGRQRRQILKQQERAAIMFGMGAGRRETLGGRIDLNEQWSEEDMERQRRHYEERFALGDEFQERQRQYIEERRILEDELQMIREFNAQYAMQAAQEDLELKTRINAELKAINAAHVALNQSTQDEIGKLQTMITTIGWFAASFEEGGDVYNAWSTFLSYIVSSLAEAQASTVDLWEY